MNTHAKSVHIFSPLSDRLSAAKAAYSTRRVDKTAVHTLVKMDVQPRTGDVLLARVSKLGHHKRIELEQGRLAALFEGDEIVVCYGHRYAPDQFEAEVPADLGECHLVAAGGIASRCLSRHEKARTPTVIEPIGLLGDVNGQPINVSDWAIPDAHTLRPRPFVIAVVGTSMNAGKTTSAAHLIKGLTRSGLKVGAAKVTGTGAGGDRWLMKDSGAIEVLDFTDAGFSSTYQASIQDVEHIQRKLTVHLGQCGAETVVMEVADGLFQRETNALLSSPTFLQNVDAIVFAAGDAMGACGGVQWLRQQGLPVVALSGCLSASPLATREAAEATGLPVFGLEELADPEISVKLFERGVDWAIKAAKAG